MFNSYFDQQFVTISNLYVLIGVHSCCVFVDQCHSTRRVECSVINLAAKSYLVDSASSHMLISKIKPCMSKYMPY